MSLNFAAISPHPPIIIPKIGTADDLKKVDKTIRGLKMLAQKFKDAEIDTLVVISPHSLIYPDRFNICGMENLEGSFGTFGKPEIAMTFGNNLDFVAELDSKARENNIETLVYNNDQKYFEMDHGLLVPLFYLANNLDSSMRVVPIAYSGQTRADHFAFGQTIRDIAENFSGRIGILASGDLSHQLIQSSAGKEFDKTIVSDIENLDIQKILYYDEEFVEFGAECGYRSILILLGAIDGKNAKSEILSYEGPFGVGYLVANFTSEAFNG